MIRFGSCNTVVSFRSATVRDILGRERSGWMVTENDKIMSPYPWETAEIAEVQAKALAQIRTAVYASPEEIEAAKAKAAARRAVAAVEVSNVD